MVFYQFFAWKSWPCRTCSRTGAWGLRSYKIPAARCCIRPQGNRCGSILFLFYLFCKRNKQTQASDPRARIENTIFTSCWIPDSHELERRRNSLLSSSVNSLTTHFGLWEAQRVVVGGEGSLCEVNEISVGLVEKEVGWCLWSKCIVSQDENIFFPQKQKGSSGTLDEAFLQKYNFYFLDVWGR